MLQMRSLLPCLFLAHLILPASTTQIPLVPQSHTEGYKFNALLHLPGISPYFDAIGSGLDHAAPQGCEVTAASYLVRHAAIYANDEDYEEYIEPFLLKLNSTLSSPLGKKARRKGWKGPLEFFNAWENPIDDPDNQLEQITPQGIEDAKRVGKHLLSRYPTLVPTTKRIYADKKARTKDTAAAFIAVFPQDIEVVQVDLNRSSFHAQDPHKACKAFSKEPGSKEQGVFVASYTQPILERLREFVPEGVSLDEKDIMGMQQLCGYESAITGQKSAICAVFGDSEWMAYEYAWDMKYSYMVGHGNPLSPYLGFPWLHTTAELMAKLHAPRHGGTGGREDGEGHGDDIPHDDGQRFFLAFTHREVPPFIATALGLFNSSNAHAKQFPTDRINWSRSWRMSELIPFLGHVGLEKLTCKTASIDADLGGQQETEKEYIRITANTAPRPIPRCQDGPGASCAFDGFRELVREGMREFGDFDGVCGNGDGGRENEDEL